MPYPSDNLNQRIGDVFTPIEWGKFIVKKYSLLEEWLNGKSFFDPTMGTGQLLESLVQSGIDNGYSVEDLPIHNLFGCELNTEYRFEAVKRFQQDFGIDMSENFIRADFLLDMFSFPGHIAFDILLGNPPWINFVDLPNEYKERLKPLFLKYDLAENAGKLLLGGSRIELAALVVQKALTDFLKQNGRAVFFLPLSLFLNDGVHGRFRRFCRNGEYYALKNLIDFNDTVIFPGIATRYGVAEFKKGEQTDYPVFCERIEEGEWKSYKALPLSSNFKKKSEDRDKSETNNGAGTVFWASEDSEFVKNVPPLSILSPQSSLLKGLPQIAVEKRSFPRQGINTCGANDIFFFDTYFPDPKNPELCIVSNGREDITLPAKFVYPLITKECFNKENIRKNSTGPINSVNLKIKPQKWVLLPYNKTGKPLSFEEIKAEPALFSYLKQHEERLNSRKGVMINSQIKRGVWWALLGVGEYNYAPFKIVWESFGRKAFNPFIFSDLKDDFNVATLENSVGKLWQANQALQAFIPCRDLREAERILGELKKPEVEEYLLSLKMPGTMNWAQPGKIKRLLISKKI